MSDVVQYLNLASAGSAALGLLVAMLFIESPSGWLRLFIVGAAALAIAAPVVELRSTLGAPSPWLEDGRYRLLGWKADENAGQIYILITHPGYETPRQFQIPFDLDLALKLQDIRGKSDFEELLCMQLDRSVEGKPPVEVRSILAPTNDLFQSCDLLWR